MESILAWFLVILVGALAGGGEILSRYRDEPFAAATSHYGLTYMALNGVIAALAYAMFGFEEIDGGSKPAFGDNPYLSALAVGSGAMLILRSKLFTMRSENGKETSFGPAIILEALLVTLDRAIDRKRASARHKLVYNALKGVHSFDQTVAYFQMSLLSFQNLSENEKADLVSIIDEYKGVTEWSPALKTMAVGFAILGIAGEANFGQFVDGLKAYLASVSTPPPPTPTPTPTPVPTATPPPTS